MIINWKEFKGFTWLVSSTATHSSSHGCDTLVGEKPFEQVVLADVVSPKSTAKATEMSSDP